MEASEQIEKFKEFLEAYYEKDLIAATTKGRKAISIDFNKLAEFDVELSEDLLDAPPDSIITEQEIPLVQVDTFLSEQKVEKIDFLRMDVEGYEFHIIQGMKDTIQKSKPMFQIEVHASLLGKEGTQNFLKHFQNLGYEAKYYVPRDIDLPIIGSMSDVKQYDIDTLLNMLDDESLSHFFNLCLKFKDNNFDL